MSDPSTPSPAEGTQPPRRGLLQKLLIVAAVVLSAGLGMAVTLLLLSDGETSEDVRACIIDPASRDFTGDNADGAHGTKQDDDCPPKDAVVFDGLVEETTKSGFTLRVIEEGRMGDSIDLHVRTPDRPYIDIAHAQTHAALGQPVRVYTEEIDGRTSIIYMEDAPLLG